MRKALYYHRSQNPLEKAKKRYEKREIIKERIRQRQKEIHSKYD